MEDGTLKEEYYRMYTNCIMLGLRVSTAMKAAKIYVQHLQEGFKEGE
jgi:hypothetical protein